MAKLLQQVYNFNMESMWRLTLEHLQPTDLVYNCNLFDGAKIINILQLYDFMLHLHCKNPTAGHASVA